MSLTAAFVAHELRIQGRSLRYRVAVGAYLLLGAAPALLVHLRRAGLPYLVGPTTYIAEVLVFLPQLTALFAALLALDGITREQQEGAWTTLSLAGISNAGYLLRRWAGLLAAILPWTALPFLAAFGLAVAGDGGIGGVGGVDPLPFIAPWLLHIAPLAAVVATLSLSLGTISGGLIGAAVLLQATLMAIAFTVGPLLFRLGYTLQFPFYWLDARAAGLGINRIQGTYGNPLMQAFPLAASESGVDFALSAEQHLAQSLFLAGLAAAALALAVLFLGRTRPDVRPWRIRPDHPLRTYLRLLVRAWQRGRPDPRPARRDLLAAAAALLVTAGAIGLFLARSGEYQKLARQRYDAEIAGGPGTPLGLQPGRWRIAGRLGPGTAVDLRVAAELRNTGAEPARRASFQINPELTVTLAAPGGSTATPGGRRALRQTWDRLEVTLDPPIPPGGRRELLFHVAGQPAEVEFSLPLYNGFVPAYRRQLKARFSRELSDLSLSYRVPSLSRPRIALRATDLSPVPRYQPWDLQEEVVPEDAFLPAADLEVALDAEPGLFLADACGGIRSGPSGVDGRLESRCRLPVAQMLVAGGPHRLLDGAGERTAGTAVALFPAHSGPGGPGELHLGFLQSGARMMDEAWPGLADLRQAVVLEWPNPRFHNRLAHQFSWYDYDEQTGFVQVQGNLIFLQESRLIGTTPLQPEYLVSELATARLLQRRSLKPEDAVLFERFFRALAAQRLGLGHPQRAVVGPLDPGDEFLARNPPPDTHRHKYWRLRFGALVAALEARVGAEALRLAVDEFLGTGGPTPGSAKEMLALIERRSEAPAGRLIQDLFVDGFLPEPVLDDVQFRAAAGGGWRVTGRMTNQGDGEALCRVVLTTDLGPVETMVRADTGESTPFELSSRHRPQAVLLDPDQQCQRLVRKGVPRDRVYFQGSPG